MGRVDDSLSMLQEMEDGTERALQLAGLISTLFKIRGVALIVTGKLAFDSYANTTSRDPELELAPFTGRLAPRLLQEIMGEQLHAVGAIDRWTVVGLPVRFHQDHSTNYRELCRDYMTDHGVVKLIPAEEITAAKILAAVYPAPDPVAGAEARLLLVNGVTEAFRMDWTVLQKICHQPEYRIGEELAQMRAAAKQEADEQGLMPDSIGETVAPAAEPIPAGQVGGAGIDAAIELARSIALLEPDHTNPS
jgi:hypothetical protein